MPAIRTIEFERDEPTDTRAVIDIREFEIPASPLPRSWTELTKDHDRRILIMDLMRQIADLQAGHIHEIHIFRMG